MFPQSYIIGDLDIYFSFASLADFLGPEISVWKFWPQIPLTFHWNSKTLGPRSTLHFFQFFSYFAPRILQVWFYYQNEQNEGVSQRKIPFLFLVNHPNLYYSKFSKELKNNIKIKVGQAVLSWIIDPNKLTTFWLFWSIT